MEIELSDVSSLPDAMKGFVSEKDGKHVLDLGKAATDLDGWKSKTQTAQGEAIDRRKALKAWEALGADPTEVQAKLAKGADPAIIDQMRADFAAKETGFKSQLTKIVGERATSDLKAELAKAGIVPEGLDLLANFAARQIAIDDDGSLRVVDATGKPMIGNGANGGATLADLAKALVATNPLLVADKGVGGGGKQPGSATAGVGKAISWGVFEKLGHPERAAFLKDGGKITD